MIIHVWAHSTHGLIWLYYAHECVHLVSHVDVLSINLLPLEALNQHVVTRSLTEAEYKAFTDSPAEILWIQSLLSDLYFSSDPITILWCDNLGVTCLLTLYFMLALSMLKSIITLFVIALLKRKLQFGSSHPRINLLMYLPNLFPRVPSLIFDPNFMWILLLQL